MATAAKTHAMRQGQPPRPPMDPAHGVRDIKLSPDEMTARITAVEDLFVLAHFGVPHVDPSRWSLAVDGLAGRRSTSFTLDELKARPKKVVEAVHQCCGSPLEPRVPTRRVANVRWGGVDLAVLLDELGIDPDARFLWSYGLDGGAFSGKTCDWFMKDMPLERLATGDVLLAYEVNDRPLSAEHGFPARLVVPGFYGTNSVKWLWRLHLASRRADGLFTTEFYNDEFEEEDTAAGLPARRPVWAIAPEAIIVSPGPGATVALREPIEIHGWAWSSNGVAAVELSVDGGESFAQAALEKRRGWTWQRFSRVWRPSVVGEVQLCARAAQAGGVAQPPTGARNAMHRLTVLVQRQGVQTKS